MKTLTTIYVMFALVILGAGSLDDGEGDGGGEWGKRITAVTTV